MYRFLYWCKDKNNKEVNFMSENLLSIGDIIFDENKEPLVVVDMDVEEYLSLEELAEVRY